MQLGLESEEKTHWHLSAARMKRLCFGSRKSFWQIITSIMPHKKLIIHITMGPNCCQVCHYHLALFPLFCALSFFQISYLKTVVVHKSVASSGLFYYNKDKCVVLVRTVDKTTAHVGIRLKLGENTSKYFFSEKRTCFISYINDVVLYKVN